VKKLLVLVGLTMIGVLMFASVASAQSVSNSASASGSASAHGRPSYCSPSPGKTVPALCHQSGHDVFSVSGPSASPFASPNAPNASPTASTPTMPGTGGLSPTLALVPLALIVGGGLLAFGIVRRR
jgi:hypothetical protein